MSTNKHASFRYRVLDGLLQRNRAWTLEELKSELSDALKEAFNISKGVGRRTLFYDLQLMKSEPPLGYAAPIECNHGKYTYTDRKFSIHKQPLSEQDMAAIRSALMLLSQFKGLPTVQPLEGLLNRLEGWVEFSDKEFIQFETNELSAGTEWLEKLYKAIAGKQSLGIQYQPFTAEEVSYFVFHPYFLKEYRNRWFVYGLNEASGGIYNLALDRIQHVSLLSKPYQENTLFDPVLYFKDIIGVTRPENATLVTITFRASALQSKYLLTKPIHPSQQKLEVSDEGVTFSLDVIPNYELYSELLRLGRAVKVISPVEVINAMKDI